MKKGSKAVIRKVLVCIIASMLAVAGLAACGSSRTELEGRWVDATGWSDWSGGGLVVEFSGKNFTYYDRHGQFNCTGTFSITGNMIEFVYDTGGIYALEFVKTENTLTIGHRRYVRER